MVDEDVDSDGTGLEIESSQKASDGTSSSISTKNDTPPKIHVMARFKNTTIFIGEINSTTDYTMDQLSTNLETVPVIEESKRQGPVSEEDKNKKLDQLRNSQEPFGETDLTFLYAMHR